MVYVESKRRDVLSKPTEFKVDTPKLSQYAWILYMPIKLADQEEVYFPAELMQFKPLIDEIIHEEAKLTPFEELLGNYIYVTVKTLPVGGNFVGNRPGWHIDGFGTEDVNWIFSNHGCTHVLEFEGYLPEDHTACLNKLKILSEWMNKVDLETNTLHRLNNQTIHAPPTSVEEGSRTFVKVSFSEHKYNLLGNAINPDIAYDWVYHKRDATRNHTSKE